MNINSFDLNLLRVLDALLRDGSTVKAGARLGMSQPAVSAALGRLRHALGDPLFLRRGQGLEATDFARGLAAPLREALDGIEVMLRAPGAFDPETAEASFRISGSDFFAEILMPRLAELVSTRAPGVRVQLIDLLPENHVETLERYHADLALVPHVALPPRLAQRPLFRSGFSVIARDGHPRLGRAGIAPGDTIPIDLFCDLGHVLFSPQGNLQAMGDAALARVGRKRRVVMTLPVFSGVCQAVSESELIALIPTQLAQRMARKLPLRLYRPPMTVEPALIAMIWHQRSEANPAHQWLRDVVAEVLEPLDSGAPAPPGPEM